MYPPSFKPGSKLPFLEDCALKEQVQEAFEACCKGDALRLWSLLKKEQLTPRCKEHSHALLHAAAANNSLACLGFLLNYGWDVNEFIDHGKPCEYWQNGTRVTRRENHRNMGRSGSTALRAAVRHGQFDATKLLLDKGASVIPDVLEDVHNEKLERGLQYNLDRFEDLLLAQAAAKAPELCKGVCIGAAVAGNFRTLEKIYKCNVALDHSLDRACDDGIDDDVFDFMLLRASAYDKGTCLLYRTEEEDLERVRKLLDSIAPDNSCFDAKIGLMNAVDTNSPEIIDAYLAHGLDPNQVGPRGITATHQASASLTVTSTALEHLLKNGADPNLVSEGADGYGFIRDGYELGATAYMNKSDLPLHGTLHGHRNVNEIKRRIMVLVEAGADVRAQNCNGETPLHTLMRLPFTNEDRLELFDLFIQLGAGLEIRDRRGRTAMEIYETFKRMDIEIVEWDELP